MQIRSYAMAIGAALLLATVGMSANGQDADAQIYGRQLMTDAERDQYREQIRAAKTDEARRQLTSEHRERMQARARERKVELPDVPSPAPKAGSARGEGPQVRGRELMTDEGRAQHREEMRKATSDEQREKLRERNHEKMKKRGEEQGVSLPDQPLPRAKGMGQGMGAGQGAMSGGGSGGHR